MLNLCDFLVLRIFNTVHQLTGQAYTSKEIAIHLLKAAAVSLLSQLQDMTMCSTRFATSEKEAQIVRVKTFGSLRA